MKYVFEQSVKKDCIDWELLESIARTYGKTFHQLTKKQKREVKNIHDETMQQYDDESMQRNYFNHWK